MNEDALWDRRRDFLTQRIAGGTFSSIAARYNQKQVEACIAAGRPADEAETVSAGTVSKDCDIARATLLDEATRDALRGEHRAILLDMRRANYLAMASGDVDAAKIILSTLVRESEMLGLDEPKRTQVGVGTTVEFASDLVALIEAVGYQPPSDLVFAASGERAEIESANTKSAENALRGNELSQQTSDVIDAHVVGFDLDAPEPSGRAAYGVPYPASVEPAHDAAPPDVRDVSAQRDTPPPDAPWSNL